VVLRSSVSHDAADDDQWHAAFTDHEKVRRSHGATGHRVYRSVDDPGAAVVVVVVVTDFAAADGARGFLGDPSLEQANGEGVITRPEIGVCETTETVAY
jgi:hypothetical protein